MFELRDLRKQAESLPEEPGVYLFKKEDRVLYVGKAKSLRKRVLSYFSRFRELDPRIRRMLREAEYISYIVTRSEGEALLLEANLIKRYRAPYNILLRDDKRYPYVVITGERYPRVFMTRRRDVKGTYFGPFPSALSLKSSLKLLRRVVPFRTCSQAVFNSYRRKGKPCLLGQIGRCPAPCVKDYPEDEYRKRFVEPLHEVFSGNFGNLLSLLEKRMHDYSRKMEFEKAARVKELVYELERAFQNQFVEFPEGINADVYGYAFREGVLYVVRLKFREGKLVGREGFFRRFGELPSQRVEELIVEALFSIAKEKSLGEIDTLFLPLEKTESVAREVDYFSSAGVRVNLIGDERCEEIFRIARINALDGLKFVLLKSDFARSSLRDLKELLSLQEEPIRIEGIDVSHTFGKDVYASVVSFVSANPDKRNYRIYRISSSRDDVSSIREVIKRRYLSGKHPLPDLLLIDGGVPQVREVVRLLGRDSIPGRVTVVGIAKGERRLSVNDTLVVPVPAPANHVAEISFKKIDYSPREGFKLLQRVRNEAHRFAVEAHRKARLKRMLDSVLEKVPGIGHRRIRVLLKRYSSLDEIRKAPVEELASLPGMNFEIAKRLKESL